MHDPKLRGTSLDTIYGDYIRTFPPLQAGGGLRIENVAIWCILLSQQKQAGINGDLLEIGVWQAHSAALMASFVDTSSKLVLIDVLDVSEAIAKVVSPRLDHDLAQIDFINSSSFSLANSSSLSAYNSSVKFAHIDGQHSYHAVYNDLDIVAPLMCEGGIISVDDVFDAGAPSLTEALFKWLDDNSSQACLFLSGFGKAYICHPRDAHIYMQAIHAMPHTLEAIEIEVIVNRLSNGTERIEAGISPRYSKNIRYGKIGLQKESMTMQEFWMGFDDTPLS